MKELVILTLRYPDPFLDRELPYLSRAFRKVYVLPQVATSGFVKENVVLTPLFEPLKLSAKLMIKNVFGLLRAFIYMLPYRHRGNYLRYYRSFIGHYLNEAQKVTALKQFILAEKLQDAIFYDYWMVDATLALAILKRSGLIRYTFARTHRFDLYDECQFEGCVSFREYRVKYLDAVFAISQHGYEYMRDKLPGALKHKMRLSRLGVSIPERPNRKRKMEGCDYVVVSCSRLVPFKRVTRVAKVLKKTKKQIHWVHFGDGPLRDELQECIKELPLNLTVDLKGPTSNHTILEFYRNFHVDLFVSLSESEGIPVSMMEAISFGIPLFACDVDGVPEIVNELTGKLIPVNMREEEAAEELEQTVARVFDREKIYNFFSEKFDANRNYTQFVEEIYRLYGLRSPLSCSTMSFEKNELSC
jgi:glycosyltransferase involved in cell wall biosynthesis